MNGCPPLSELHGVVSYNGSAVGGRYLFGPEELIIVMFLFILAQKKESAKDQEYGVDPLHCAVKVRNINK